jgi:hypothetical protein
MKVKKEICEYKKKGRTMEGTVTYRQAGRQVGRYVE